MASNMKQQYFILVSLFIAINLFVCIAGEEVAAEGAKKETQDGSQFFKIPTLVLRQNGGETDYMFLWTKWPAVQNQPWSGGIEQFTNAMKPYTSQANQWIERVPGLSDAIMQGNNMGSQMSGTFDMNQITSIFQNLGR